MTTMTPIAVGRCPSSSFEISPQQPLYTNRQHQSFHSVLFTQLMLTLKINVKRQSYNGANHRLNDLLRPSYMAGH